MNEPGSPTQLVVPNDPAAAGQIDVGQIDAEVFDFLALNLTRARSQWQADVLGLVQSVATRISRQFGTVREAELEQWCRRRGLPCPEVKHLFDRTPLGEWHYLRAGAWWFEPRELASPVHWLRNWGAAPRQLPEPSEFFKPNQRSPRHSNEERTANQRAALRGKGRYHGTTIPRGEE
jgi:hypothetical protein